MKFYLGILAGGKSQRFGSNKALYNIDGMPIIVKIIDEILQTDINIETLFISLHNRDQVSNYIEILEGYIILNEFRDNEYLISFKIHNNQKNKKNRKSIKLKFLFDEDYIEDNSINAAIIGLYSIFKATIDGIVHILPCDTPNFSSKSIIMMFNSFLAKQPIDALIPKWNNGFIEPLTSIYRSNAFIQIIESNISNRIYSIRKIFNESIQIHYLNIEKTFRDFDPEFLTFKNINFKDDIY